MPVGRVLVRCGGERLPMTLAECDQEHYADFALEDFALEDLNALSRLDMQQTWPPTYSQARALGRPARYLVR